MVSSDDDNSRLYSSQPNIKIYSSIEEFDENLPNTIELIKTLENDRIYIVGTAHYSLKSQDDVSLAIRNSKPNGVVLELCALRTHILELDEKTLLEEASSLTASKIRDIILKHGFSGGMFYLSFLKTSANITKQLGIAPGGECRRAIAEAKQIPNCKIFLGDRPINITINRAIAGLTFMQRLQLSAIMNSSDKSEKKITQEVVEEFKNRDIKPLKSFEYDLPSVYHSFITERDYILAHSLESAKNRMKHLNKGKSVNIIGVVGIGHMNGILSNYGQTTNDQVLEYLKMPKLNKNSPYANNFGGKGNSGMTSLTMVAIKKLRYLAWKGL